MAKFKFAPNVTKYAANNDGQYLYSTRQGNIWRNHNLFRAFRTPSQKLKQMYMMDISRRWKELSASVQNNWHDWAYYFPQSIIKDKFIFIKGYQLFLKINWYKRLREQATFTIMEVPYPAMYASSEISIVAKVSESKLILELTFTVQTDILFFYIYASSPQSPGLIAGDTRWRFMSVVSNVNATIDISNIYLAEFGSLPKKLDNIFFSTNFVGFDNGQYSFHKLQNSIVQELPDQSRYLMTFNSIVPISPDPHNQYGTYVEDPYSLNEWNAFFGLSADPEAYRFGPPFTSINVVGNSIDLQGSNDITLRDYIFYVDTDHHWSWSSKLVKFDDYNGQFTAAEMDCFGYGSMFEINLPALISCGAYCFEYLSIGLLNLPSLITPDYASFYTFLGEDIRLDSLIHLTLDCDLNIGQSLKSMYFTKLTTIDQNVFSVYPGQQLFTITIPIALMTSNSGSPDPQIQILLDAPNVTVITIP